MTNADMFLYGSANRPTDDSSTIGGAIDTAARPISAPLASAQNLELVSDGADTRDVTVVFRVASGALVTEVVTLTGASAVAVPNGPAERVESVTAASADGSRTVTLRVASAGATVHVLNPTETEGFRLYRNSKSSGAGQVILYEVLYWANTHGTDALLAALHQLFSDPDTTYRVGLATAKGDVGTLTNRVTAPGGITFVDDNVDQGVPGTDLAAGERIGVYVEATLAQSAAALKSAAQLQMAGGSA